MADLPEIVTDVVRRTRREKALTQSELAELAGCKQSAISMFESGRTDALSAKNVQRIAELLGIDLKSLAVPAPGEPTEVTLKCCPVDKCPSNVPYVAGDRLCFKPAMVSAPAKAKTRCGYCGEVMESRCTNRDCRAELSEGAFCPECGTEYVVATTTLSGWQLGKWAGEERARIREIRQMSQTVTALSAS